MAFNPTVAVTIIAAYMVLVLIIGLTAWRLNPSKTLEQYLLADRNISGVVGFFSIAASQMSALTMMGFIAFYYQFGVATFIAIAGGVMFLVWGMYYIMGPRIWKLGRRFGHITPSDTVRSYYDSPLLGYLVAFGLILALIPYLQLQFTGVGLVLDLATAGAVPVTVGAGLIAAVIALYTFLGGMKSVAWVDTLQGVMLMTAAFVGGIILLFTVGGGLTNAVTNLLQQKPGLLSVPGPAGVWDWPFIATFALAVHIGWILHPHIWMRIHYFKDGSHIYNIPWLGASTIWLTQIGGLAAVLAGALVLPDVAPDQFIPLIYREFFPVEVFGLIMAAIIAAIMSSASSQCHGIGAVVSRDITRRLRPTWRETRHVLAARAATVLAIVLAFLLSTQGIDFLLTSGAAAAAFAAALIFPQALAAVYGWRWPTRTAAIAAAVAGSVTALIFIIGIVESPYSVWPGVWGLAVNIGAFILLSQVTDDHPARETVSAWEDAKAASVYRLDEEYRAESS